MMIKFQSVNTTDSKGNILIVDDELELCELLEGILKAQHFNVFSTHTLSDATNYVDENEPSIIFLDNILPDGKGVNLIKKIREDHPQTKIILMTNALTDPVQEKALKDAALFFLHKPLSKGVIQIIMNEVSSSHHIV